MATFDAMLSYPPLGLLRSKVRDISLDGMFVETRSIALHANTPVEVTVRLRKGNTREVYRLRAFVVRVTRDGAGLMFRDFDDATFRTARALLLKSSAAGKTKQSAQRCWDRCLEGTTNHHNSAKTEVFP